MEILPILKEAEKDEIISKLKIESYDLIVELEMHKVEIQRLQDNINRKAKIIRDTELELKKIKKDKD